MLEERCGVCNAPLYEVEHIRHRPGREITCRVCKTSHVRQSGKYVVAEGESKTQQYGAITEFAISQPLAEVVSEPEPQPKKSKATTTTKKKSSSRTRRR